MAHCGPCGRHEPLAAHSRACRLRTTAWLGSAGYNQRTAGMGQGRPEVLPVWQRSGPAGRRRRGHLFRRSRRRATADARRGGGQRRDHHQRRDPVELPARALVHAGLEPLPRDQRQLELPSGEIVDVGQPRVPVEPPSRHEPAAYGHHPAGFDVHRQPLGHERIPTHDPRGHSPGALGTGVRRSEAAVPRRDAQLNARTTVGREAMGASGPAGAIGIASELPPPWTQRRAHGAYYRLWSHRPFWASFETSSDRRIR